MMEKQINYLRRAGFFKEKQTAFFLLLQQPGLKHFNEVSISVPNSGHD